MEHTNVIIRPLITEKTTHLSQTRNSFAFEVHKDANKVQIKNAIESIYSVIVTGVRTQNRKGKPRRGKFGYTQTSSWKRAIVTLDENHKIDLF